MPACSRCTGPLSADDLAVGWTRCAACRHQVIDRAVGVVARSQEYAAAVELARLQEAQSIRQRLHAEAVERYRASTAKDSAARLRLWAETERTRREFEVANKRLRDAQRKASDAPH
jgi:uncharacterized Zn finger protein (UPF0148 family)